MLAKNASKKTGPPHTGEKEQHQGFIPAIAVSGEALCRICCVHVQFRTVFLPWKSWGAKGEADASGNILIKTVVPEDCWALERNSCRGGRLYLKRSWQDLKFVFAEGRSPMAGREEEASLTERVLAHQSSCF